MEPARSSGAGSGNSGTYSPEMADSLRFEEEIQSLMLQPTFEPPPVSGSSFTALLGLPLSQAVELFDDPPPCHAPSIAAAGYRVRNHHEALALPLGCSPTFPSNAALIDRAARFSVFAAEESPEASNSGEFSPANLKAEPADSGERPFGRGPAERGQQRAVGNKRKEAEKVKAKSHAKKSKSAEGSNGGEQLPYVHVRARRGQATDSHSLAERARREKINARMKLLQELVPGCSKISGTALVLDEIISHVQSLQRQVEFLSMRLAAVNPRIDFSGLDNVLSTECGRLTGLNGRGAAAAMEQSPWADGMMRQQMWMADQQQQQMWETDDAEQGHVFAGNPGAASIFAYGGSKPNSGSMPDHLKTELVSLSPNQLKTEM